MRYDPPANRWLARTPVQLRGSSGVIQYTYTGQRYGSSPAQLSASTRSGCPPAAGGAAPQLACSQAARAGTGPAPERVAGLGAGKPAWPGAHPPATYCSSCIRRTQATAANAEAGCSSISNARRWSSRRLVASATDGQLDLSFEPGVAGSTPTDLRRGSRAAYGGRLREAFPVLGAALLNRGAQNRQVEIVFS